MRGRRYLAAIFVMVIVAGTDGRTLAQEPNAPKPTVSRPTQTATPYQLDFVLTETDNGKKIDSRHYTVTLSPPPDSITVREGHLRIGTRVPVGTKSDGTTEYIDAGTSINTYLVLRDGVLTMNATCDVTSMAPEQQNSSRPVLRTLTIGNNVAVVEGKALLVGIVDDPNSNREFRLEVTVTEFK